MKTRRSWRNQNRVWKILCKGDWQTATSPQPTPLKPTVQPLTSAEIDSMWWLSKQSRRLLKLDISKTQPHP